MSAPVIPTDRRLLPANGRVAATWLDGHVTSDRFVEGTPARVARPVLDLCAAPEGARARQMLRGEAVTVYETREGWCFVQRACDGYVGYVPQNALSTGEPPTHRVATPATHLYPAPDMKRRELAWLSFGSQLRVVSASGDFYELDDGSFVPRPHLRPINRPFRDPVTVAQLHFGVPYLWGGNSTAGIDCSGLVQAALLAAGLDCPGDSDQQAATLGALLAEDAPLRRGDLLFWKGHVAMAVDGEILIHANAHHMGVAYEPVAEAVERIAAAGDGPVTARRRL